MTTRSAATVVLSCLMTIFLFAGCSDVRRAEDVEDLKPNNSDVIELNIKIIETDSGIEAFDVCTEDLSIASTVIMQKTKVLTTWRKFTSGRCLRLRRCLTIQKKR